MSSSTPKSAFWRGFRHGLPFVLVVGPFAALFGVVATEAGLNVAETMAMSVLVIAGAAQFAALQQMSENAPTLLVLATALTVNLRMGMYSAALAPHLGATPLWQRAFVAYITVDQNYALAMVEYDRRTMTTQEKLAYFVGAMAPIAPFWYAMTLIGALVGERIPPEYALDFALPITFIAMMGPLLRTPAHVVAALVSVAGALALGGLPYGTGLLIAAFAAMTAGAQAEVWLERRKA